MSLPIGKHRLLTYALIAHELNNFQSSHFVQLFNFKEDLPIVDVPTEKEYYRRKLTKECKTLKDDRTQEINRLHALFLQCGITTMKRSNLQTDANRQKVLPQLFGYEVGQAQRVCERLTLLETQIKELEIRQRLLLQRMSEMESALTMEMK